MTKSNFEYNPFQGDGDIFSFLNDVTKKAQPIPATSPAQPEVVEAVKYQAAKKGKGMDMTSDEAFPTLCSSAPATATGTWGQQPTPVPVAPSVISQSFELPLEQQKHLRHDPRDKNPRTVALICREIATRTKTTIDASTSSKTQSMTFIIRGKAGAVAEAKRVLWAEIAQSMSSSCEVPEEYLGSIIGASGRTIKSIMSETGTNINVARQEYPGYVTIIGDYDGIQEAKARILAIVEEKAKRVVEKVELPSYLLSFVYGVPASQTNEQANVWSQRHSVRISHDYDRDKGTVAVSFAGDRDEVRVAFGEFTHRLEEEKAGVKSISTAVPKALHKFLIGQKHGVLHELEAETGCVIQVPSVDTPSDQVTVYGRQEKLFKGISAILEKTNAMASEVVKLPKNIVAVLYEKFRGKINELHADNDVAIVSVASGIEVNGIKTKVQSVAAEITALATPLMSWKFDDSLQVDPKYFGHIIGKKGQKLKELEAECGAYIIIPNSDAASAKLLIAGPTDAAVKTAKVSLNDLLAILKDFQSVEARVENKYHRLLIGKGGAGLQKYSERFPSVVLIFEGDSVTIKGASAEVNGAQALLKGEVDGLKHDAVMHGYTCSIDLKGEGRHVVEGKDKLAFWAKSIAGEHDVKLEIQDGKLQIQGLKKLVEEAKVAILEKCQRLEQQGSVTVELAHEMHSALIGKAGKNVKHLDKKYQVHLAFPEAGDAENNSIVITGPKSNLAAAKSELVSFYEHLVAHQNREEMSFPSAALPRLIGKGGDTIESLRLDHDVSIDIDETLKTEIGSAEHINILLKGTVEGIEAARKAIQAIANAFNSETSETVDLDAEQVKALNGTAHGFYLRFLDAHQTASCHILLFTRSGESPRIVIRGLKEEVGTVVGHVRAFLKDLPSIKTISLVIPSRCHGELIGSGGETVKKLSAEYNVRIDIPRGFAKKKDEVTVTGLAADLERISPVLMAFVKEEKKVRTASRKITQSLISKFGPGHKDVRFTAVGDGLLLQGSTAALEKAFAAVSLEMANQLTETLNVPKQRHGSLIGPGGSVAMGITDASGGCQLIIPARESASEEVKLVGSKESVAKAKAEIERILSSSQQ